MHDVTSFGLNVLIVSAALTAAMLASKVGARLSIPSAALFLAAAAVASDVFPRLVLSIHTVERIAAVALIVILFDGGSSIGWRRFRSASVPITTLGVIGTFLTAGALTLFAHWALGLAWITSGLLGAAVAPTDPAVMFSLFSEQSVVGRTGTILEGESGANDPVGIALMLGLVELATRSDASFWIVVRVFVEQMGIGLSVGLAGGLIERELMQRLALPSSGLHTVRTLAVAGLTFGIATVAHGSGFLAVFVAGLLVGDVEAPYKTEIEVFQNGLATVAEITVFIALGLTIPITHLSSTRWLEGIAIAAVLAFVARPLVAGALLLPVRLRWGERLFVIWGGLKGAVPILLATFVVARDVGESALIYQTVFVVVLVSVVVQGGTILSAAERMGILSERAGVAATRLGARSG